MAWGARRQTARGFRQISCYLVHQRSSDDEPIKNILLDHPDGRRFHSGAALRDVRVELSTGTVVIDGGSSAPDRPKRRLGPLVWTAIGCGGAVAVLLLLSVALTVVNFRLAAREVRGGRPPAWVPLYPGASLENHSTRSGLLRPSGTFRLWTGDSIDAVRAFYDREIGRLGFRSAGWHQDEITSMQVSLDPQEGREMTVMIIRPGPKARDSRLLVRVFYQDRYRWKR
jgi:hypothetical protein